MSGVLRNWLCLNKRCNASFTAWEENPECPSCRCVRVQWLPGGGHVAGTAGAADAEVRKLADLFGMTDMNSAERGRGAKKIAPAAPTAGPVMTFAPGFSTPVGPTATCLPSTTPINFKVTTGIGQRLSPSKQYPGISSGTVVHASHRGKP